jgi:hypothetical protein
MAPGRLVRLLALAAGLLVALIFARQWPRDQTFHYVLGDSAPRVEELVARMAPGMAADGDWTREATFRYEKGLAPRVVTHELRLADGDYTVEIEIVAASVSAEARAATKSNVVVRKHVTLSGGATSIDVGELVPR